MRINRLFVLALALSACSSGSGAPGASGGGTTTTTTTAQTTTAQTSSGDAGGDTWASFAQGFFSTYCVECHDAAKDPSRDYTKLTDVMADAALIRCGVAATQQSGCGATPAPKQFPISDATGTNPKPTDAERARIVAWIEAGLP
jgi:hypothetical protein